MLGSIIIVFFLSATKVYSLMDHFDSSFACELKGLGVVGLGVPVGSPPGIGSVVLASTPPVPASK